MDSFEVIIAPKALEQLDDYISYIQYTLLNPQAAVSVWQDAINPGTPFAMRGQSVALRAPGAPTAGLSTDAV